MSDDALRTLEREARATADGQAVLRWAAALDRAGRRDEAHAALVLGRDDPAVRVALGGRPPEPGPPILSRPVVRWRRKQAGNDRVEFFEASPLGVVLGSRDKVRVLDPDDGSTRFELKGSPFVDLVGDVVLGVRNRKARLEAHDVWTGERLHVTPLHGLTGLAEARLVTYGRWLHIVAPEGARIAYDLSEPRQAPRFAWRLTPDEPLWPTPHSADHLPCHGPSGDLRILDLRTGELARVQADGLWLSAGHGLGLAILRPADDDAWPIGPLRAYDLETGALRWTGPSEAWRFVVPTPDGFLGGVEPGPAFVQGATVLVRLDRAGRELERCDLFQDGVLVDRVRPGAGVDYAVVTRGTRVVAWPRGAGARRRGKGGPAWGWTGQAAATDVHGVVACLGRLYLHVGRATVVCLEAPP